MLHFCKILFQLMLLVYFSMVVTFAQVINVIDYGAKPNDEKDDTKALRKAVEKCRLTSGSTLVFPPGIYILKDEAAVQLENDVMVGKYGSEI